MVVVAVPVMACHIAEACHTAEVQGNSAEHQSEGRSFESLHVLHKDVD